MKKFIGIISLGAILFALTLNFSSCNSPADQNQLNNDTINGPLPYDSAQSDTLVVDTSAF